MKSLKKLILTEDVNGLDRYNQYNKSEGDPVGAAQDLQKLLSEFVKAVELSLQKAGPFMAETVLNDFLLDLKEKTKPQALKMPSTSSLGAIMADLDKQSAELDAKDAEKAVPEKKPAAAPAAEKPVKKPIKVP
jgi:hypothetical protein